MKPPLPKPHRVRIIIKPVAKPVITERGCCFGLTPVAAGLNLGFFRAPITWSRGHSLPQLLHREHVYDAVLDDELFGNLPSILNQAYDARSCTLHWRHEEGSAEMMAHSGHFTKDQMLDYANNVTETDLWSLEALRPSCSHPPCR